MICPRCHGTGHVVFVRTGDELLPLRDDLGHPVGCDRADCDAGHVPDPGSGLDELQARIDALDLPHPDDMQKPRISRAEARAELDAYFHERDMRRLMRPGK